MRFLASESDLVKFDYPYYRHGSFLVGVDEVGRGPIAGPLYAAACHLPLGYSLPGINDSKKLSPKKRAQLSLSLKQDPAVIWSLGIASVEEIDTLNVYQATLLAMDRALTSLALRPSHILVDAMPLSYSGCGISSIIQGDAQSQVIAAASILAKEARDDHMRQLALLHPEYGFKEHKGYPTAHHLRQLELYGPSPIHRRSYRPVREWTAIAQGD